MNTNVIVVASTKGGVCKTTTAVSLAAGLAQFEGVVLVDLDSQGQVALHFGMPSRSGVFDWLSGTLEAADCTYTARPSGLSILAGDSMTKALYNRYTGSEGARAVAEQIRALGSIWHFVVVDTAAGGLLQEAALMAADQVIVPFRPESPSIDAMFASLELVKQLAPTDYICVLPTAYDGRLREHKNNLAELDQQVSPEYGCDELYAIRNRIAVAEAIASGSTIWEYNAAGLADVRVGYTYLVQRTLAQAGYDVEGVEALSYAHK